MKFQDHGLRDLEAQLMTSAVTPSHSATLHQPLKLRAQAQYHKEGASQQYYRQ